MSNRPRPVTATVTKPKWMEPQVLPGRSRSLSLDSTGSTSSLVSILDHDSYDSYESDNIPVDDNKEVALTSEDIKQNDNNDIEAISPNKDEKDSVVFGMQNLMDSLNTDDGLSSWESWLIRKTKLERQKHKELVEEKMKENQEKHEQQNLKKLSEIKAEEKRKIWLEKKNYEEKLRKKMDKQQKKVEEDLKRDESRRIQEKADRKFREWMDKKNVEHKQQKRNDGIKMKEKEELKKERQKIAEEKFEKWYKSARKRPKSVLNSFCNTSGKLSGYQDRSAYPVPSFCNPVPWHPVQVQKVKSDIRQTRQARIKYQWNPDKYR